jgi:tetratricopeptide (TPR) repeat protein
MIRGRRAWLLCFLFLVRHAAAQAPDTHLQRGVDLMREFRFAEALPELEQAQRARRASPEIENLLGITTSQLGRLADADSHYRRAIALNPRLASPHKNLGFNELNERNYVIAERELKIALALNPGDEFIHYYLATLYLATSQDVLAVDQIGASQELLARDPEDEFLMAKACLRTGHNSRAVAFVKSLEDQSLLTPAENYELALLFTNNHLYPEAVQRFEYAVATQSQSHTQPWIARYDLAVAELNDGHADKALLILQSLAIEQPGNAAVLSSLGSAYESAAELPLALDAYQGALRADPQNPDRYLDYTRLLMDLDRDDEAMKVVEEGMEDAQDSYALDIRLGVLRVKQGRYEDARVVFNQAIALHPELVLGYVALAQSYLQQGTDDKAVEALAKARAALPQDATLEYYFGLVALRLGRYAEAEAALRSAERLHPEVFESHYQLGRLYLQTGRLPEAKTEFEVVIRLAPNNSNAHYQLSKIYARLGDTERSTQMADATKRLMQSQREAALQLQKTRLNNFQPVSASK